MSPGCNTDIEAQRKYLGSNIFLNILYNQERVDLKKFGEEAVIKESKIYEQLFKTDFDYT